VSCQASRKLSGEDGTASIELIAAIPFLLLAALVAAQIVLAGQALWSAGMAVRAGARASLVGGDVSAAVRRALPPSMRRGSIVDDSGPVGVRVRIPGLLPGVPLPTVGVEASLSGDG
jgi:hypothetical protein